MNRVHRQDAVDFCRSLERYLVSTGYHVGLRGALLITGESTNDIDLILYPHDSTRRDEPTLRRALGAYGMRLVRSVEQTHAHWRTKGSSDEKRVEIWSWHGLVIDILLL